MRQGNRRWLTTLLLGLMILPLQAAALSLGDLVVRSVPGEPLRAHIPFTLLPGETLTDIRVTLATAEQYQSRDIPRAELLQEMGIALVDRGEGKGRVQLFAERPWQGEEIALLLFVSWPEGVMERRYRLAPVAHAQVEAPRYVGVAPNETLDEIAIRLSKGSNRSYLHMMYALFLANPDAFYRGNMNNLKTGQRLRVPTSKELYALGDSQVFDGIRSQYEKWEQMRESGDEHGTQAGEALVGMSNDQTAALDLSGDSEALQQRLQQVAAEGEAISQENAELRARLRALEKRMESVAGQVMEYGSEQPMVPEAEPSGATAVPPTAEEVPPQQPADTAGEEADREGNKATEKGGAEQEREESDNRGKEGLSGTTLIIAIALVLLLVYYINRSGSRPRQVSL